VPASAGVNTIHVRRAHIHTIFKAQASTTNLLASMIMRKVILNLIITKEYSMAKYAVAHHRAT
jgi:hypothetical protein